jgi:hypothetical protein
MTAVERQRVIALRAHLHGLHGGHDPDRLGVLALGLQDAPPGSAELGLAVRTADPRASDGADLVRVLGVRGAPHLHRRADLPRLRAELRPRRPEELLGWLAGHGPAFLDSGVDGLAVLDQVVDLLRSRFPGEQATKGELSGAISPALPAPARPWCEACGAEHVIENLFRLGTLLAGLELDRGDRRLVFRPPKEPLGREPKPDGSLLRAFARYAGPIKAADVTAWFVSGALSAKEVPTPHGWADIVDNLGPVTVDGEALIMSPDELATIDDAPPPPPACLLPPRDPYLLGNRTFIVSDREIAKRVWRAQVSPGVLLIDGEVRGIWRQTTSGRTLTVQVTPFGKPRAGVRRAVSDQAALLAAVRGAHALESDVRWE